MFGEEETREVFRRAIEGRLRDCPVRSVAWRFFLGTLPLPLSSWPAHAAKGAADYAKLREEHCPYPSKAADDPEVDLAISNPLSQHVESPWQNFFEDSELRSEILKDLERLYPDDPFFEQPLVREQMLRKCHSGSNHAAPSAAERQRRSPVAVGRRRYLD